MPQLWKSGGAWILTLFWEALFLQSMSFNLHFVTDYCEGIVDLARDVDVLLLECSYPEHIKVDGHLNSTLAGRKRENLNAENSY